MKLHKPILYVNLALLLIFGIYAGITAGSVGIGIAFSLIALLNLPVFVVGLITKNQAAVRTSILFFGVFLLIGFSICSTGSWGNMH